MTTPMTSGKIRGRSWLRGEVGLDEIRKLTKPFGVHASALFADDSMKGSIYDVLVVDGPLRVKGDFDSFREGLAGLVVRGNLTVEGLYTDTDDPATGVYVLGDMRAGRVITNGALGVSGSLVVDGPLVGFYNDYSADVGGDVHTPCFYPENHSFDIGGKLEAGVILGYGAEYRVPGRLRAKAKGLAPAQFRAVLRSEVLNPRDDDGEEAELDYDAFKDRVRAGLPVLLAESAKRAAPKKLASKAAKNVAPKTKKTSAKKASAKKALPKKKARKAPAKRR